MDEHALAWRPTRELPARVTRALWTLCLMLTPLLLLLEQTLARPAGTPGPVRLGSAVTVLWLLVAWWWPTRRHRTRMLGVTLALAVVAHLGTLVVPGVALDSALRAGLAVGVQAAVTLAWYRWRVGDDNLTPHRPRDVADLAVASIVGALAGAPFVPEAATGDWPAASWIDVCWWTVPSAGYVFVGAACLMLLVQRRPRTEAIATRLGDVYVQLIVTTVCIAIVLVFDDGLPLTWLVILLAVWAGLTMGPWTAAAYSLTGALAVVAGQTFPDLAGDSPSQLAEVLVLDSLMASFAFVVLLLSAGRDQRAHLAGEVVRRRQQALDQAGLLGTVFESISEALVLLDDEGHLQLHNSAALHILGPDRLETEPRKWLRQILDRPVFTYAYHRDGTEDGIRMLAVQLAPVQYAGADSVVAIVRDVTTEQRRIEELASFAAVAAHDLKSPLAAVQGWLEVAEDTLGTDPGTALLAVGRGRRAADRMSTEIEDWLAYNVAREGVLNPEAVELQPFVEAIVDSFPDSADVTVKTPDTVLADPTLLRHLLVNLVGNALKYTEPTRPASVTVSSSADAAWVSIEVADAGIGIPDGEETTIFEPFHRASSVQGTYEGSGLGLALCKRIVRRHGGRISARRNLGPGSTVTAVLPRG